MKTDQQILKQNLRRVAEQMLLAARTAPKARGKDNLYAAILSKDEIDHLARIMIQTGKEKKLHFFQRDGHNLEQTDTAILLGTSIEPMDLPHCGFCGYAHCDEKREHPDTPCAFNTGDLGIALGSAVSVAMNHRADNRIMFTAGKAALQAGILPDDIKIAYVVPLSGGSKNPYFDRK
ncbi:MAG: ferredoxin domain-containing protein [Bacteroidota bacterium]